jgi:hypothetical protein
MKVVLTLSAVGNSVSPSETLKKGGLERLAAQWGSLDTFGTFLPLDLSLA